MNSYHHLAPNFPSLKDFKENLFNFSGRLNRFRYICYTGLLSLITWLLLLVISLFALCALTVSGITPFFLGGNQTEILNFFSNNWFFILTYSVLGFIIGILFFIIGLSLLFRRLHDFGWSGWHFGITFLLIIFSSILSAATKSGFALFIIIPAVIYLIVVSLIAIFRPGNKEDNKYGSNPITGDTLSFKDVAWSLSGRLNRTTFFWYMCAIIFVSNMLSSLSWLCLILIIPQTSIEIRRCYDLNISKIVPISVNVASLIICLYIISQAPDIKHADISSLVAIITSFIFLMLFNLVWRAFLCLKKGDQGDNQYGPDPETIPEPSPELTEEIQQ